jgi:predicted molibdopterin-dependent oxidoreductase YjgC
MRNTEQNSLRIEQHPILGDLESQEELTIYFDGKPVKARGEEPIAAALLSAGFRVFRKTKKRGESRGLFCAIGRCTDCMMVVDGVPNVRTCVTPVREGMDVRTQYGLGEKG